MIKYKYIFNRVSIIAISVIILGCNQDKNFYSRECQKLVDIGKNEDKVKYIYSWFNELEKDIFLMLSTDKLCAKQSWRITHEVKSLTVFLFFNGHRLLLILSIKH